MRLPTYTKWIAVFLLLVTAGVSGWQMTGLELWGYRPLFVFAGAWGAFLLMLDKRISKLPNSRRLLMLSVMTGLLLAIGFPPLPGFPFLFVGFVPLLIVEKLIGEKRGFSRPEMFKFAMIAFMTWNIFTTWWVSNSSFMAGILAIIPNSILMSIPFVVFHFTKSRLGNRLGYSAFVAYWILFEFIHHNWASMSWPWLTLGNSFAGWPQLIQWYEYTGVFGGSFWILVLNVMVFNYLDQPKERTVKRKLELAAAILLPIAISLGLYFTTKDKGELTEVVIVQPNYEPHYVKPSIPEKEQVRHFLELAEQEITESTDYLVFPETSFDNIRENDLKKHSTIVELQQFANQYPNLHLVTGISSYRIFDKNDTRQPMAPRTFISNNDTIVYEGYNAAIQLTSKGDEIPVYYKSKLVPGPEIIPMDFILKYLKPVLEAMGGTVGGLGTQKDREVFFHGNAKTAIAPVICYESVYGGFVTGYVKNGASAIFIVTNDGWWDNTSGHIQHLMIGRLRAIETRRTIARSANTGISCFINQRGDILQATEYEEDAVLKGQVALNDEITFYVKYGNLLARIALFWSIVMLLMSFVRNRIREVKKQNKTMKAKLKSDPSKPQYKP